MRRTVAPTGLRPHPSAWLIPLAGLAGGMAIANVFYAQPLLPTIAAAFHVDASTAATWSTLTQAGFAIGLLLVLPLGDELDRRRLAPTLMLLAAASLAASALAPSFGFLAVTGIAVGMASVVSQLLVALAADIAPAAQRGRVVAWVMTGVLLGAQLSRTVSGLLAEAYGWRSVYGAAAVGAILMTRVLWLAIPSSGSSAGPSYRALIASVGRLALDEPVLRLRALYAALAMGAFSIFWTAAGFFLAGPPHHLSVAAIGLFSLSGLAGPAVTSLAGRLGDAGRSDEATGAFSALTAIGFVVAAVGRGGLIPLAFGAALLTAGSIGLHVTSQAVVLRLRAGARSRLNSVYMTSFFLGGVGDSATAGIALQNGDWTAVCVLGGALAGIAIALWLREGLRQRDRVASAARLSLTAVAAAPTPHSNGAGSPMCVSQADWLR